MSTAPLFIRRLDKPTRPELTPHQEKITMPKTQDQSANHNGQHALSKPRLDRMHQILSGYIDRQELPGLVALVSHHDDVHIETLGTLAFNQAAPMRTDTIFRIASLAKPVTAVL
jgi:CubicO group peptidase (beta-lactamase class C family)